VISVLLLAAWRVDACFLTPPLAAGILGGLPVPLVGILDVLLANLLLLGIAVVPWLLLLRAIFSHTERSYLRPSITALP